MGSYFCFISACQNSASVNMYIMCTFLSVPIELIPRSGMPRLKTRLQFLNVITTLLTQPKKLYEFTFLWQCLRDF